MMESRTSSLATIYDKHTKKPLIVKAVGIVLAQTALCIWIEIPTANLSWFYLVHLLYQGPVNILIVAAYFKIYRRLQVHRGKLLHSPSKLDELS